MRTTMFTMSMAVLLAACGSESPKATKSAVDPGLLPVSAAVATDLGLRDGSDVTGKVAWKGEKLKKPKSIKFGAEPYCEAAHPDPVPGEEYVVAEDGGVQWAFVYVTNVDKKYDATGEAVLDQSGCMYKPHVLGVMVGQTVKIKNSDKILHNIHGLPTANKEFNMGQPKEGQVDEVKFTTAEMAMKIKCDVHPWMGAWAHVMTHPFFATSGADGSFKISGLPAGKYKIAVWHESFEGAKEAEVEVDGKGPKADVNFELNAKKTK